MRQKPAMSRNRPPYVVGADECRLKSGLGPFYFDVESWYDALKKELKKGSDLARPTCYINPNSGNRCPINKSMQSDPAAARRLACTLRDGSVLEAVLPYTARQFARAIIMPNLSTPVTTPSQAAISAAHPASLARRRKYGTFYAADDCLSDDEIQVGDLWRVSRWCLSRGQTYPANATGNSSQGVTDIKKLAPVENARDRYAALDPWRSYQSRC